VQKTIISSFILLSISFLSIAQDTDFIARGKVIDVVSGKGINAKIRYKSIPTGSISGSFQDSIYSFSIFGSAKYLVSVEAPGFIPRTAIVDPKDINTGNIITRNVMLTTTGKTIRLNSLIFGQRKAVIDPRSYKELDEIILLLESNPEMIIQLEGHTDSQGSSKANMKLSEDRVEAVKRYFTNRNIAKNRIKTKAFGGTQPLANEMTPAARALNRRVEMRILKD
jgi:outer membrane protein OmpA-like peptidoglycan-associated protein